jgi:hypothetical protein
MKIKDMLGALLNGAPVLGTFSVSDLFRFTKTGNSNGIATARSEDMELYLAIINGEAEGAIYLDANGELFGDKAVMRINGREMFTLYEIKKEFVDAVAMGCRVFEKSHLRANTSYELPEFGTRSAGIGNLTLVINQQREPQNGIRVSIRKDGKIVGSDITTQDGSVGFRVMYGNYDIILQDRNQMITTRRIKFDEVNPKIILEL